MARPERVLEESNGEEQAEFSAGCQIPTDQPFHDGDAAPGNLVEQRLCVWWSDRDKFSRSLDPPPHGIDRPHDQIVADPVLGPRASPEVRSSTSSRPGPAATSR